MSPTDLRWPTSLEYEELVVPGGVSHAIPLWSVCRFKRLNPPAPATPREHSTIAPKVEKSVEVGPYSEDGTHDQRALKDVDCDGVGTKQRMSRLAAA
ncbi:hypothetical protein PM082_023010 [Marasmius tenuissimus]|nr:hypothetical protein PM082_023010 [Marasmius tenuissimus]